MKPIPPTRSHSLEQNGADKIKSNESSDSCNPYASSPVVIPAETSNDLASAVNGNSAASAAASAVPPSGYVLAGQMNLGSISVPALNSANLSKSFPDVTQ